MCEPIGPPVQLPVGHGLVPFAQCQRIGHCLSTGHEQLRDIHFFPLDPRLGQYLMAAGNRRFHLGRRQFHID